MALARDLRFSLRFLVRNPGYSVVALLTLALGIGGTSAVFSVVDGVLLSALPYPDADRLVVVRQYLGDPGRESLVSYLNFEGLTGTSAPLRAVAAAVADNVTLLEDDEPVRLSIGRVSPRFLDVVGVDPLVGRGFSPDETTPGAAEPVMLLSEGAWRRRFGADRAILGRALAVDGVAHTVVGVLPSAVALPTAGVEAWLPDVRNFSQLSPALIARGVRYLDVYARLGDGVGLEAARAHLDTVAEGLAQALPERNKGLRFAVRPLAEEISGPAARGLWVLFAAVLFVLVIACVNVANLLLARLAARREELGIRGALGGTRARVFGQLLTEGLTLALAGGALGLVIGVLGVRTLVGQAAADLPRLDEIGLDARMVTFTALVAVVCGIGISLAPAWRAAGLEPAVGLQRAGRSRIGGALRRRVRHGLMVLEVSLSVVVLVGAGLLVRSFVRLGAVDPGFRTRDLLTMELTLAEHRHTTDEAKAALAQRLVERIEALPGVRAAAVVNHRSLGEGDDVAPVDFEGRPVAGPGEMAFAYFRSASPEYLRILDIPLRAGRRLDARDRSGSLPVAVVNETFVRENFAGEDPVGKRFKIRGLDSEPREIVGVVGNVAIDSLREPVPAVMYVPYDQLPRTSFALLVDAERDAAALAASVRAAVREVDPEQPVFHVATMEEVVRASISRERFYALAMGVFAALAAVLAMIGIYGVVAYTQSHRTSEVGVRLALGAERRQVIGLVLSEAFRPTLVGLALGLAGAFAVTRSLSGLLYGVSPTDPATLATVCTGLAGISLLAALAPAWQASRVDPARLLRVD